MIRLEPVLLNIFKCGASHFGALRKGKIYAVLGQEYLARANSAIERTVMWFSICIVIAICWGDIRQSIMGLKHFKSIFSDLIFHNCTDVKKTFYLPSCSLVKGFFNSTVVISQEKRGISVEM